MLLCKPFLSFSSPLFAVERGAEGEEEIIGKVLVCYVCCLGLLLLFTFEEVLHGCCSMNK